MKKKFFTGKKAEGLSYKFILKIVLIVAIGFILFFMITKFGDMFVPK